MHLINMTQFLSRAHREHINFLSGEHGTYFALCITNVIQSTRKMHLYFPHIIFTLLEPRSKNRCSSQISSLHNHNNNYRIMEIISIDS